MVHAGGGGEETGNSGRHLVAQVGAARGSSTPTARKIFAYLTIPEDAKIGVGAHELGHLLFGFPDLYDVDYTSEGIGNWCLMAGGSWNGGGDTPAHPSAWCKAQQGWVGVENVTHGRHSHARRRQDQPHGHRLWTDGTGGQEYFLLENRQQAGFDAELPAEDCSSGTSTRASRRTRTRTTTSSRSCRRTARGTWRTT